MSAVDVTSLSTKGQVVIPQSIRDDLKMKPGAKLMVVSDGENVLIRPLEVPKLETFKALVRESRAYARRAGLKKEDVGKAVRKARNTGRR